MTRPCFSNFSVLASTILTVWSRFHDCIVLDVKCVTGNVGIEVGLDVDMEDDGSFVDAKMINVEPSRIQEKYECELDDA